MILNLYLRRRLKGYSLLLRSIVASTIIQFPKQLIIVLLVSSLAILLELGGIASVHLVLIENGMSKIFALVGADYSVLISKTNLDAYLYLLPVILLSLSAVVTFISTHTNFEFSKIYGKSCVLRLLKGLEEVQCWPKGEATREFNSLANLSVIQRKAMVLNARIIRVLLMSWSSLVMFCGGLFYLLYMDFQITLMVVMMIVIILMLHAFIGFYAARNTSKLESASPKIFKQLKNEISIRLDEEQDVALVERKIEKPIDNFFGILKGRIIMVAYSRLVVSLGMIGVITMVFIIYKNHNIVDDMVSIIIMLFLIIRVFYSLKGLAASVTLFNRFYPHLSRYYRLMFILHCRPDKDIGIPKIEPVRIILTDMPNNKLNQIRWQWLIFGGMPIKFTGNNEELLVRLITPKDILNNKCDVPKTGEVWVDLEKMRRDPVFKIYADNIDAYVSENSGVYLKMNEDDDDDALEEEFDVV